MVGILEKIKQVITGLHCSRQRTKLPLILVTAYVKYSFILKAYK